MVMNRLDRVLLPALLVTGTASAHEVHLNNTSSMPWTLERTDELGTLWDDAVVEAYGRLDPLVVDRHMIAAYRLTDWHGHARATLCVVGFTVKGQCTTAFMFIRADPGFEHVVRKVYRREAHNRYRLVARSYDPSDVAPSVVCPQAPRRNPYLSRLGPNLNPSNAFRSLEFPSREEEEVSRVRSLLDSPQSPDGDLVSHNSERPPEPVARNLAEAFALLDEPRDMPDEHGDDEEDPPHTP